MSLSTLRTLPLTRRIQLVVASWSLYATALILAYLAWRVPIHMLTILPLLFSAWVLGSTSGLVLGVLTYPANLLVLGLFQPSNLGALATTSAIAPSFGAACVGLVIGWLGEYHSRLQAELKQRQTAEELLWIKTTEFDTYLSITTDLFCIANLDGYFKLLNPQWESTLGYAQVALLDRPYLEFVHPQDQEATLAAIDTLNQDGALNRFTNRYRHQNGSYRWLEWNAVRLNQLVYATARDITERKVIETALQDSEARFRSLFKNHIAVMLLVDFESGEILEANLAAEKFYGYSNHQLSQMRFLDLNRPADQSGQTGWESLRSLQTQSLLLEGCAPSHQAPQIEVHSSPIALGERTVLFCIIHDVTEREQAKRELQNQRDFAMMVMNTMGQGLTVTNQAGEFEYINPAYAALMGCQSEELLGKKPADLTHPDDLRALAEARLARREGYTSTYEARLVKASGELVNVLITGAPRQIDGKYAGAITVITDLTALKQAEAQLLQAKNELELANLKFKQAIAREQALARTDTLTNLHNRRYFFELATYQVGAAIRYTHPLSAIMFDIDHFKQVNDTYGHQVGDQVLRTIAQIVQQQLREADLLARYGGEEFIILLPHIELAQALAAAERIRQAVESYTLDVGQKIKVTVSMGVSELLHHEEAALDQLVRRADQAMYQAKHTGRNHVAAYQPESKDAE